MEKPKQVSQPSPVAKLSPEPDRVLGDTGAAPGAEEAHEKPAELSVDQLAEVRMGERSRKTSRMQPQLQASPSEVRAGPSELG